MASIQLVVVDNEGCFIPAKGRAIPLESLAKLRTYLDAHSEIKMTFCTGRSVPYMEAMVQLAGLLESTIPVICEGGAVFYWPAQDRWEALVPPQTTTGILEALPQKSYRLEPGKVVCVSLYPEPPETVASLLSRLDGNVDMAAFSITSSPAAVDITPQGVNKGYGLRRLAAVTGIPLENILCIGDAANDLSMLTLAGYAACPANAAQDVKHCVSYVSSYSYTEGVLDILRHFFGM
jgi:hydroxymethylpyrimidine pyrophosphatase-like HAD family hydrolase